MNISIVYLVTVVAMSVVYGFAAGQTIKKVSYVKHWWILGAVLIGTLIGEFLGLWLFSGRFDVAILTGTVQVVLSGIIMILMNPKKV